MRSKNRRPDERFTFDSESFLDLIIEWIYAVAFVIRILPVAVVVVIFLWFFFKTVMEAHFAVRDRNPIGVEKLSK